MADRVIINLETRATEKRTRLKEVWNISKMEDNIWKSENWRMSLQGKNEDKWLLHIYEDENQEVSRK